MELLYGTMAILILRQRNFTKMALIQEKVHRIILARKTKNYRPRSFAAWDGSFAVFLCLDYCIAKIYECGIIKIERQPPTRWVASSMW